jgi:hypothetical protein
LHCPWSFLKALIMDKLCKKNLPLDCSRSSTEAKECIFFSHPFGTVSKEKARIPLWQLGRLRAFVTYRKESEWFWRDLLLLVQFSSCIAIRSIHGLPEYRQAVSNRSFQSFWFQSTDQWSSFQIAGISRARLILQPGRGQKQRGTSCDQGQTAHGSAIHNKIKRRH